MSAPRARAWDVAIAALTLATAYALKAGYARASAEELEFLLRPTAFAVGLALGHDFVAEAGAGYVSRELHVAIAPVCSGMNFLIVTFTTLVLGFLARCATPREKFAWFAASLAVAYAATLLVNTLRISLSLAERGSGHSEWLSAAEQHRATGVGVYLGCLLLLYAAVDRAFRGARSAWGFLVPISIYLGLTLLVPLARGASASTEYRSHAAVVLGVSLCGALLLGLRAARIGSRELPEP
jgi:exosortase K